MVARQGRFSPATSSTVEEEVEKDAFKKGTTSADVVVHAFAPTSDHLHTIAARGPTLPGGRVRRLDAAPRDADQEKRRGNPPESPPPTATGNAGQQQAEPASSTMKTSLGKGKGRWQGEEGRDQKKPQSPNPPTSPPPAEPAP